MSNLPSGYMEQPSDPLYEAEFMRDKAERSIAAVEAVLDHYAVSIDAMPEPHGVVTRTQAIFLRDVRAALDGHRRCDCVPELGPPHCHQHRHETAWPCAEATP